MSSAPHSRESYVRRVAGDASIPWWDAVLITAGNESQARVFDSEIRRRRESGRIPPNVRYLVVPDPGGRRIGSGGATLHALHTHRASLADCDWESQRLLLIHAGGESRRLPQYAHRGKLFSALPVKTPWGEISTVFDEILAFSTAWVADLPAGMLVSAGDVLLDFDASRVSWRRHGVTGVAIAAPSEVGSRHGVYVVGDECRVYAILQKPAAAQMRRAGALAADGRVAVDSGLLYFAPDFVSRLAAVSLPSEPPVIDLYEQFVQALTGQWVPGPADQRVHHDLAAILKNAPFHCSVVEGEFVHIGATEPLRRVLTGDSSFLSLYTARQRLGSATPAGVASAGVIIDSILAPGSVLEPGSVAIECQLDVPVRAGRGSILHGLTGHSRPLEVPEDTVVHQVPVVTPGGRRGIVLQVYPVEAGPAELSEGGGTLWEDERFPLCATADEAWEHAFLSDGGAHPGPFLSMKTAAEWTDQEALAEAHNARRDAEWQRLACSLAQSGADIRPLLAHAPRIVPLARAGRDLLEAAQAQESASLYWQASLLLAQAGMETEAAGAREQAFESVAATVAQGVQARARIPEFDRNRSRGSALTVAAPARIDLGGGWSDTPPFCIDWGGTVLNAAIEIDGSSPIQARVAPLDVPLVRMVANRTAAEFRTAEEIVASVGPGDPFAIHRSALRLWDLVRPGEPLPGLEIRTDVNLPMGSGLGTSSILAAAVLRALCEFHGAGITDSDLCDWVLRLEQQMGTGGGWQDQAGGVFPGVKLVTSGPGSRQRLRVEQLQWTPERQSEFEQRLVLYYTGIRRVAKNLLAEIVGSYLARETRTVQILHSIKTLAVEMSWAMREGDWDYLGSLLDRHWQLNILLDPNTTNAPINAMLAAARPYIAGAKLAGAGGGGFILLLARDVEAAQALRSRLSQPDPPGSVHTWRIALLGLHA